MGPRPLEDLEVPVFGSTRARLRVPGAAVGLRTLATPGVGGGRHPTAAARTGAPRVRPGQACAATAAEAAHRGGGRATDLRDLDAGYISRRSRLTAGACRRSTARRLTRPHGRARRPRSGRPRPRCGSTRTPGCSGPLPPPWTRTRAAGSCAGSRCCAPGEKNRGLPGSRTLAAMNGQLEVLQWARAHGCPWGEFTCAFAAMHGHLDVLKWARAQVCTWNAWTCAHAAREGHLEVLR